MNNITPEDLQRAKAKAKAMAMELDTTDQGPPDTTGQGPVDTDTDTDKPKKRRNKGPYASERRAIENAVKKYPDKPAAPQYNPKEPPGKQIRTLELMKIEAEVRGKVSEIGMLEACLNHAKRDAILEQQQTKRNGEYDPEDSEYLQSADWVEWDEIDRLPPEHLEAIAHETRKALNFPIFCPESRRFYVYDGQKWEYTMVDYIEGECLRAYDRARPKGNGDGVMGKVKDIIKRLETKGRLKQKRHMNDRVNYINIANGRLCLENWRVQRHRKSDLCTRLIDVEVTTDTLEAIRTKTTEELLEDAPKFKQFLLTTFKGYVEPMKTIKLVQEIIGYIFTPHCYAHKGFFFVGNGRNGKSVLCDIITGLVGTDSVSHIGFGDLCDDSKLALMTDKAVNVCNDAAAVKFSSKKSSDKFKSITAGDPISFRDVYEKAQNITFPTKLIFSLNHMPEISDDSHGYAARILALPFDNELADHEQIKDLSKQIVSEELTAVAMFALQGLIRLQKRDYCFVPCEDSKRATGKYLEKIDMFGRFMDKYIVSQNNNDEKIYIPVDELFKRYKQWLDDHDYPPMKEGQGQKEACGRKLFDEQKRRKNKYFRKGTGPRAINRVSTYYGIDCHYHVAGDDAVVCEF